MPGRIDLLAAELLLLRVAKAHVFPDADATEAQVRAVEEAEEYLAVMGEPVRLWGVPIRTAVRYGVPAAEILDHIRTSAVNLVAMASHGCTGLRQMLLGSVAATIVRHARIPVVLLRTPMGVETVREGAGWANARAGDQSAKGA